MRTVVRKYQSIVFLVALAICVTARPLVTQQAQSNSQSPAPQTYAGLPLPPPTLTPGQQMVVLVRTNRYAAVKFKAVTVEGKTIISGQAFQASPNWIAGTDIILRNDSSKQLVCVHMQVFFPEYPGISVELHVGKRPQAASYDREGNLHDLDQKIAAISIAPGDSLSIPMNKFQEQLSNALQGSGEAPQNVHIIEIEAEVAYFADNTGCQEGAPRSTLYSKPDIAHPGKWINITPEEFGAVSSAP